MSFGTPGYFVVSAVVGIALVALAWLVRWRLSARSEFGGGSPRGTSGYVAALLLIAASASAIFAAARPQWGSENREVEERGIDLMIVLDVSNSMLAADVAPNRLRRAQDEIDALLAGMQGDRAGLVLFAGTPFTRSALTLDLAALRTIVAGVHEERGLMPPGSDLGAAILRAQEVLQTGSADSRVLLIVSDGEDHGGSIDRAIAAARSANIHVYTAGAGTVQGSPVLDFDEDTGAPVTRVDASGAPVLTRLDRAALEGMASSGGGRYVELSDSGALAALAAEFDALNRTTFATEETSTPIERFQVFAGIALAAAMGAMLVGHVRVRTARRALRLWPAAGAAIFIAGICASDAADHNRRGNRHYADGEFGKALDAYRTAQSIAPDEGELFHNAGNALNRAGELSAAIDETMKGLPEEDDLTAAILEYSLGNHYSGAQRLEEALAAYRRALLADPEDVDAKYNFELTARRLTPQPSPTPTVPLPELGTTPTPDDPTDQGPPGTPGAGGTPDVNASPQAEEPGDIPPEQLERLLEEALAGIDEEFTVDEAIRVLELVEQRNRDAIDRPQGDSTGLPDY